MLNLELGFAQFCLLSDVFYARLIACQMRILQACEQGSPSHSQGLCE